MREYVTPDFDVTVFDFEEICVNIISGDPNPSPDPGDEWWG